MRTQRGSAVGINLDSLLDTMTNVVGILIVLLVVVHVGASSAVRRVSVSPTQRAVSSAELDTQRKAAVRAHDDLERSRKDWTHAAAARPDLRKVGDLQRRLDELNELGRLPNRIPGDPDMTAVRNEIDSLKSHGKDAAGKIDTARAELATTRNRKKPDPVELRVPVLRAAPKQLEPLHFVVRGGRILPFDMSKPFETALRKALGRDPSKKPIDASELPKIVKYFDDHDVGNEYFRIRLENLTILLRIKFEGRPAQLGETAEQLTLGDSVYSKAIGAAKPSTHYINYLVWSDSFATYLKARAISEAAGFCPGSP